MPISFWRRWTKIFREASSSNRSLRPDRLASNFLSKIVWNSA